MVQKPAPYSSDVRAKGWRFELDMERIRQSDTWALASPELRPWLLMLWSVAWEQTPCGSLPTEANLIAARLGMRLKAFAQCRDVLLRGWYEAEDGRLYHETMTERVRAMMEKRAKDAKRAADHRSKTGDSRTNSNGIASESRVTPPELATESDPNSTPSTKHQAPSTGTSEESPSGSKGAARRFSAADVELPDWLKREDWQRWCKDRAARRKPITEEGAQTQLRKLDAYRRDGHSAASVIEHSIAGGYAGLFPPPVKANGSHQSQDERIAEGRRYLGFMQPGDVIDA